MSGSQQLRSLYRRVLRELPSSPNKQTILSSPSALQRHIRSSFSSLAADGEAAAPQLEQAEQFVQYIKAQRMYLTLVERYNTGANMSTEERVRLTARKVGMDLPVGGSGKGKGKGKGTA